MVLAPRQDGLSFGKESTGRALTYRGQVGVAKSPYREAMEKLGLEIGQNEMYGLRKPGRKGNRAPQ